MRLVLQCPNNFFLSQSPFGAPSRRIVPEIDTKLVTGRFKLRHHEHDGLDRVLEAYGVYYRPGCLI